jgi:hypothetical protein
MPLAYAAKEIVDAEQANKRKVFDTFLMLLPLWLEA